MDENTKAYKIPFEADLLPTKDNQIFKSMLTCDIPESKVVLKSILSDVIGYKVTEVIIRACLESWFNGFFKLRHA